MPNIARGGERRGGKGWRTLKGGYNCKDGPCVVFSQARIVARGDAVAAGAVCRMTDWLSRTGGLRLEEREGKEWGGKEWE